jgi:hypothetical protein
LHDGEDQPIVGREGNHFEINNSLTL